MMESLCVGCILFGLFLMAYRSRLAGNGKLTIYGLITCVASLCFMYGESAFGFLLLAAAILMLVYICKERAGERQKKAEVIGATALDRFFVECVLAEMDDFSKPKNVQRAKLLADKYKLKYPNGIEALYQQGLEGHKAVSQRFVLNHLEDKRAEERKEFRRLNQYSDLTGKDKRIAILSDRAAELRKEAKGDREFADMLMRSGQQKEQDWAIWGGIANGLAGVGVGVSMAADVQLQNMQIRAENEKHREAALPGYMFMTNSARDNQKNADRIMEEIENIKLKLVADVPASELMKKITFSNTDVLVSETGAAMVCTSASLDPNFRIYEDVPAVVDGTIVAKIFDGDQLSGTAQLVLPVFGLGQNIPLNGICLDCCKPGKHYTVVFAPKHLWAMEK